MIWLRRPNDRIQEGVFKVGGNIRHMLVYKKQCDKVKIGNTGLPTVVGRNAADWFETGYFLTRFHDPATALLRCKLHNDNEIAWKKMIRRKYAML